MTETTAITMIPLGTPTLGDRGYLVHDSEVPEIGPRMRVTAVATPGHTVQDAA